MTDEERKIVQECLSEAEALFAVTGFTRVKKIVENLTLLLEER